LLRAFRLLRERGIDVELVMMGDRRDLGRGVG